MQRREFLHVLAAAAACGFKLDAFAKTDGAAFYDVPRFGNVSLLHITDTHAQLLPVYFREPSVNIGVAEAAGRPPHIVGEALLKAFGIAPGTREAHAFTYLDFVEAENSTGFHAPEEAERVLAESIDYARQGQLALRGVAVPGPKTDDVVRPGSGAGSAGAKRAADRHP